MRGNEEDLIHEQVAKVIAAENTVLEEWAERMLVDPLGRGILVIYQRSPIMDMAVNEYRMTTTMHICLSESVPFGHIYKEERW